MVTDGAHDGQPEANDDRSAAFGIVPRHLRGVLDAHEIAVYVALSWRIDARNECFIRHQRLADEAGMGVTKLKGALMSLRDKGLVAWRPRVDETTGATVCNTYVLLGLPAYPQASRGEGVGARRPGGRRVAATEREPMNVTTPPTPQGGGGDVPLVEVAPAPKPAVPAAEPVAFAAWWSLYPKKQGRGAAVKAYRSALRRGATEEDLLAGLVRQRATLEEDHHRGKESPAGRSYCPDASTWLNAERWTDEHDAPPAAQQRPGTVDPHGFAPIDDPYDTDDSNPLDGWEARP